MTKPNLTNPARRSSARLTWLLLAAVALLTVIPLLLFPGADFTGSDAQAEAAIVEIKPDVQPWFEPLWEPPGGETESLLFALQAALGAGVIGYYFGFKRGQKQSAGA